MTRTLEILERLIAFPTVSKDSNLDLISWAEGLLNDADFTVTRLPAPCGTKAGLHARIGPSGAGGICLSGHTDVSRWRGKTGTNRPLRLPVPRIACLGAGPAI